MNSLTIVSSTACALSLSALLMIGCDSPPSQPVAREVLLGIRLKPVAPLAARETQVSPSTIKVAARRLH